MDNRATMPKTNYYSFGMSATREQVNRVYNPLSNSPRGEESRQIPGPGTYQYKNYSVGTEGRHFSFLRRTKNSQGKFTAFHSNYALERQKPNEILSKDRGRVCSTCSTIGHFEEV